MKRESKLPIPATDILAVVASTALFVFALAFGGKLLEGYRLRQHNAMLVAEVAMLKEQQQQLEVRLEEVMTPEYVERVAREQYRWVKPGERLVIPVLREQSAAGQVIAQPGGPISVSGDRLTGSFWTDWYELLLGRN